MFLTCRLWWRSFPSPAHQTRPTVTSSPGARSRSEVWGAGVSWTAHLYRQVSSPSKSHLFCTSDHLLRSPSLGNVWHSFRNCHREFSISHLDIRTLQNHRTVSRSPHLKDRLEKNHWKYETKFILDVIIILPKKYILKIKYFADKFYFFAYPPYSSYPGDTHNSPTPRDSQRRIGPRVRDIRASWRPSQRKVPTWGRRCWMRSREQTEVPWYPSRIYPTFRTFKR